MRTLLDRILAKNVRLYTIIVFGLVLIVGLGLAYYFMPILLNYGPNTINTEFDETFSSGITYIKQYLIIYFVIYAIEIIFILYEMREFSNLDKLVEESKASKEGYEKYLRVVQRCFSIPKLAFILISIMPSIAIGIAFIFLNFTSFADFKVLLVALIMSLICGTLTFIVSKRIFKTILQNLNNTVILQKGKLKITPAIMFQITPIAAICIMYTFFLSYSNNLTDKADIAQRHYINSISERIAESKIADINDLENTLANTPKLFKTDIISMMDENGTVYCFANEFTNIYYLPVELPNNQSKGNVYFFNVVSSNYYEYNSNRLHLKENINIRDNDIVINFDERYIKRNYTSDGYYTNINLIPMTIEDNFFYTYARDLADKSDNKVFGYYGSEVQGTVIPIILSGEELKIIVMYDLTSDDMRDMFINMIILLIISSVVTYNFARSISKDITIVTDGIDVLLNGSVEKLNRNLPVTSNDELGELVIAFNKVQELTKENIVEIKNNEQMLMEKERLASLGELIGGIAHNMKTPIMSTAGAAEGLTELIAEYRASIDNPVVTSDDHKAIATDMLDCVTKIKSYNSYMSDIITAVKGQASQLASQENEKFTLYDLSKRVEILIKHEIKQANLILTTDLKCDPSIYIVGDVNSLVQVINNLISNSIFAYGGTPGKEIIFEIDANDTEIIMKVIDEGCGMNDETKAKLFKQMYTTKGKNGTGLGLYMSYSTIRGKFSGNMTFESQEGKGTTFIITLPRRA